MGRLLLLFVSIPVIELVLLIEIGQRVGTLATVGLIIVTGVVGASLARQQGLATLGRARADLNDGRLPAESLMDGMLILIAAAVLLTPGVLTDAVGFLLLIPVCRRHLKGWLRQRFERAVRAGAVNVTPFGGSPEPGRAPMKNVTPRRPGHESR